MKQAAGELTGDKKTKADDAAEKAAGKVQTTASGAKNVGENRTDS